MAEIHQLYGRKPDGEVVQLPLYRMRPEPPKDYPICVRFVHPPAPQYTAAEVRFAFLIGGYVGCMVTVALAFCWSWWLS